MKTFHQLAENHVLYLKISKSLLLVWHRKMHLFHVITWQSHVAAKRKKKYCEQARGRAFSRAFQKKKKCHKRTLK